MSEIQLYNEFELSAILLIKFLAHVKYNYVKGGNTEILKAFSPCLSTF